MYVALFVVWFSRKCIFELFKESVVFFNNQTMLDCFKLKIDSAFFDTNAKLLQKIIK